MNVCGVSMCFVNVHFRAHHENYVGRLVVSTFLFTRKTVCYVSLLNVIAKAPRQLLFCGDGCETELMLIESSLLLNLQHELQVKS